MPIVHDLSVAGKRAGLAGERSGLFMEQMRIVKEQREESKNQLIAEFGENFDRTKIKPRYMVWENVCHCGTTMITTSTGYKYIKDVEVGEMVRTHDGTYHKVLQTYKTEMQPTIKVKFQGGVIECTPNHPFLTEDLTYKPMGEFNVGDRVGFRVDEPGTKSIGMATAYAFGRWLADGSVAIRNDRKTKHRIFISTGYKKYEDLKAELSKLPYRINEQKMDWAVNFTFSSDEFGELTDSAGYGARNKQVPEWVFNLVAEERDEVLRGYLAGDGYFREDRGSWCFATSSEKLALGLCRLIRAIYHIGVSLSFVEGKGTTIIEGREVNAHDHWRGEFTLPTKYEHNLKGIANGAKYENGYVWVRIREISEGETQDVYNLSVEDNNTYEANSIICHNCGAFSSGTPSGSDFQAVLEEICHVVSHECPSVPIPKDGWPSAGNLDGVGDDGTPFSICWRLHDAQYWGVPQRRRRIALVADFGGSSAPEILFEPYSLQGNSKQSAKEGQGTPRDTSDSSGETSLNGFRESDRRRVEEFLDAVNENAPHQQDLIQSDLGVARTLACGTHASEPHLTKTLVTGNTDAKVYGICSFDSNSMKSDNPESGIYEADSARTLDLNGGNPACNQGGMAVVQADVVGCDIYNGNVTGDIAVTVTSQGTGNAGGSGPSVIVKESPKGECLNAWDVQSKHIQPENGIAESLYAGECRYAGGESYVLQNQKEPVLLESNQNHATIQTDGVSTTLPASMGEGGGYVPMVCIEGNGSRDSHKGDGYSESETMYTLNTVEQHAVAYGVTAKGNGDAFINPDTHTALATGGGEPGQGYPCVLTTQQTFKKDSHAKSSEDGQGWVSTDVNDTLNAFDNGETRTPTLVVDQPIEAANDMYVVQNTPVQSMELFHCTTEEDLAAPLKARDYKDPQVVAFEPGASSRLGGHIEVEKTGTLRADMGDNQICVAESKAVESHAQDARYNVGDVNQTLGANMEHDPANGGLVYAVDQGAGKSSCNIDEDKTPTLTTTHGGEPAVCYGFQGQAGASTGMSVCEDSAPTMVANQVTNVTQPLAIENHPNDSRVKINEDGVVQTLSGRMGTGGGNTPMVFENHSQDSRFTDLGETCQTVSATWGMGGNNQPLEVKPQQAVVRRLTPLECTRLQGFPDGWCDIGEWTDSMGKKHKDSDSPKYKALGNSIALPFWDWMAGRMVDQLKKSGVENPTMSSLFDGIAGFPYVYIRHGCMPLWTSEIEEYPIAVCKKHFGDEETGEIGDIEEYLKLPPNWVTDPNRAESCSTNSPIAFDRAAFNQGANAKYDFSVEQDTAQTLVSRGPGGVCQ